MAAAALLQVRARCDVPEKDVTMQLDPDMKFGDLLVRLAGEFELKEVMLYDFVTVSYGNEGHAIDRTSETKTLDELGVTDKSTLLLEAPASLKPERKRESKKDKNKSQKDSKYAGFTAENCLKLLEAETPGTKKDKLLREYVDIYLEDIIATPGWSNLTLKTLESIVKSPTLNIKEVDLFRGVVDWAKCECKRKDLTASPDDIKNVLQTVLPLIRFPTMTTQDVATVVAPSQLLDGTDVLEVFTYLGAAQSTKDTTLLPKVKYSTKPREGRRPPNWFTWDANLKSASLILSDKDTVVTSTTASWQCVGGTATMDKGVFEFCVTLEQYDTSNSYNVGVGIAPADYAGWNNNSIVGYSGNAGWTFICGQGQKCNANMPTYYANNMVCAQGDEIKVRVDLDAHTIEFFRNGQSGGVAFTNVNGPVRPALSLVQNQRVRLSFPKFSKK